MMMMVVDGDDRMRSAHTEWCEWEIVKTEEICANVRVDMRQKKKTNEIMIEIKKKDRI